MSKNPLLAFTIGYFFPIICFCLTKSYVETNSIDKEEAKDLNESIKLYRYLTIGCTILFSSIAFNIYDLKISLLLGFNTWAIFTAFLFLIVELIGDENDRIG